MSYVPKAFVSLVIFIIFIGSFATLYTYKLNSHFLFSTTHREPAYNRTIGSSLNALTSRIREELRKYRPNTHSGFRRVKGDVKFIHILTDKFENQDMTTFLWENDSETLTYRILANSPDSFVGTCSVSIAKNSTKTISKGDSSLTCDFIYENDKSLSVQVYTLEPKSNTVFKDILDPNNGIQEGLFYRMFYFSTVTATTLGFGEIVPLTNEARAWVAFESISGLLLMGSLVFWITKRKEERPEEKGTGPNNFQPICPQCRTPEHKGIHSESLETKGE